MIDPNELPREFATALTAALDDARQYLSELTQQRQTALDYYHERPFGTEGNGSDAIVAITYSTIKAIQPSTTRVFCGSDRTFEYLPNSASAVSYALKASDYANDVVLNQDNDGYRIITTGITDALVQKAGPFLVRWQDRTRSYTRRLPPLTRVEAAYTLGQLPPNAEVVEQVWNNGPTLDTPTGPVPVREPTVEITIKITEDRGRVRIDNIRPEEFLISRSAISVDDDETLYRGQQTMRTVSEMIAAGYDREVVEDHASSGSFGPFHTGMNERYGENRRDTAMQYVPVTDGYFRYDLDDDGIAELYHVVTAGEGDEVLSVEPAEYAPYGMFESDPEPGQPIGHCPADQSLSHQFRMSHMLRDVLDSLKQSVHPKMAVVTSQLLNTDQLYDDGPNGIVEMSQQGAVQPLSTSFTGQQAMPLMEWLQNLNSAASGITAVSQGVDVGAIQSTTAAGVGLISDASSQRIELIVRNLAMTGMRQMARLILRCTVENQATARIAKLRRSDTPEQFEPYLWDPELDVDILVGLGRNDKSAKAMQLREVLSWQRELMTAVPGNPSVTFEHVRNTVIDILDLGGIKDASRYFAALPPGWTPPQPEPQQDPAIIEAQSNMQASLAKTEIDRQDMILRDQREREKLRLEALRVEIDRAEAVARYQAQIEQTRIGEVAETDRHTAQLIADWVSQQAPPAPEMAPMAPPEGDWGGMPPEGPYGPGGVL